MNAVSRRALKSMVVASLLALVPATAFADGGAGDNQYQDPLTAPAPKKTTKKKATTTPAATTTTPATTTPAATAAPAATSTTPALTTTREPPRTGGGDPRTTPVCSRSPGLHWSSRAQSCAAASPGSSFERA